MAFNNYWHIVKGFYLFFLLFFYFIFFGVVDFVLGKQVNREVECVEAGLNQRKWP